MNSRSLSLLALGAGTAVLLAALYLFRSPVRPSSRESTPPATPLTAATSPLAPSAPTPAPKVDLLAEIDHILAQLQRAPSAADLEALRQLLLHADPQVAMDAIARFLHTGRDASTGQPFGVGAGGALSGATTLRVWLMDLLGQIARTSGSGEADALAREVLQTKTSPDEWAVSLRNVAWSEPDAKPYLGQKMREMLAEPSWTTTPSGALLEAFDVIAYTGDPTFIDSLDSLVQGDSAPLKRAALIALDHLSEASPQAVMDYLNANPALLAEHPYLRADYFAKADLTQPAQQASLEAYLSREDVTPAEKTKLIKELATPASFVSDSLLTTSPAPDDGLARQRTLAGLLQSWTAAGKFPALQPVIEQVQARLGH